MTANTSGNHKVPNLRRRTALVTGASAGIGRDYASLLARQGFDLVITARRRDRLKSLAAELGEKFGIKVTLFTEDLSNPKAPARLADKIAKADIEIDFLVNNAGYTVPGNFVDADWQAQADLIQVMLGAPSELTHIFLPGMVSRGYGRVVNISSMAGLLPGSPGGSLYGPIKSYMVKFSQALAAEHSNSGVYFQALCPGFTLSEFHDVAGNREQMNRLPKFMWLDGPQLCSKSFDHIMENKGPVVVKGWPYKLLAMLVKILPENLAVNLLSRHNRNAHGLPKYKRSETNKSAKGHGASK